MKKARNSYLYHIDFKWLKFKCDCPGLAVDLAWQGHSIGKALLRDAILRTIQGSEIVGVKALLVHAVSDTAVNFYEAQGVHLSPTNARTLFLSLPEV